MFLGHFASLPVYCDPPDYLALNFFPTHLTITTPFYSGMESIAFQLLYLVPSALSSFNCFVFFQLLCLLSTALSSFNCFVFFQLLCLLSTALSSFNCLVFFQLLCLLPTTLSSSKIMLVRLSSKSFI